MRGRIGSMSKIRSIFGTFVGVAYAAFLIVLGYKELLFGFRRRIDWGIHGMLLISSLVAGIAAGVVASRLSKRTAFSVMTAVAWCVFGILIGSALVPPVNGPPDEGLLITCLGVIGAWVVGLAFRLACRRNR